MSKYKILCVDDNINILDLYEMHFGGFFTVVRASSAYEALNILNKDAQNIFFVCADFLMPEMNGIEFRKEMLITGLDIPFVIVTGHKDKILENENSILKITEIIEKPIDYDYLHKIVLELGEARKKQIADESEMTNSFISESTPMLEEIEGLILILEKNSNDTDALNTYFRLLHTIKGTASCVGLKTLPKFVHKYEDLVSLAKEKKIQITPNFIDCLLYGIDRLNYMYKEINDSGKYEFDVRPWIAKLESFLHERSERKNTEGNDKNNESVQLKERVVIGNVHNEHGEGADKKNKGEKLAIPLEILDSFLEFSGKLTILRSTIYKAISRIEIKYTNDKDVEVLSSSIEELHKITSFVQTQISEMRKVSADSVSRPLKRVVRDTSKELKKDVEIVVHNEHLKIDNTIAKIMSNSLVHLVRNSIDHGIESPEARESKGKKTSGTIELSFLEEGENYIIILSDDGAGINKKRVMEKAIEKKIVSHNDIHTLSQSEILSLILEPGFSTAEKVSDISGRGVGMDMVKSSVEEIGGKILIDSTEGRGSKFTLILPQPKNVLINKTLMVEEAKEHFSIPVDDVVEVVKISSEQYADFIFNIGGYLVLKRYEEIIPLFKLNHCLNSKDHRKFDISSYTDVTTIIIKHNNLKMGLIVDQVYDIEESVVRKIRPVLNTSQIYSGVTYFGDDDLALVLNIENITKENLKIVTKVRNEGASITQKAIITNNANDIELFTFAVGGNQYAIDKEKVFRIEFMPKDIIQEYYNNYFVKYRDSIVKLVSLNDDHVHTVLGQDIVKVILLNREGSIYGLFVDEVFEFINTDFEIESKFSSSENLKGSIIYQDKIIYVVDDGQLDKKASTKKIDEKYIDLQLVNEQFQKAA